MAAKDSSNFQIAINASPQHDFSDKAAPQDGRPKENELNSALPRLHEEDPIHKSQLWVRFTVFILCLSFLIIGRTTLPEHDFPKLVDRAMDAFNSINAYVLAHPRLRDGMLIACSLFMDAMFFATGSYWVLKGTTSRVIVATLLFYFTRAAVQQMFYCPYPVNYYWDDPGFPSLVVPYGRSSDFFFSGHIGFVTINASEWAINGNYWMSGLIALGGCYTIFILLVYQAHYSIDIYTGIVTASLVFLLVNMHKEKIDAFFSMVHSLIKALLQALGFKFSEDPEKVLLTQNNHDDHSQ